MAEIKLKHTGIRAYIKREQPGHDFTVNVPYLCKGHFTLFCMLVFSGPVNIFQASSTQMPLIKLTNSFYSPTKVQNQRKKLLATFKSPAI
jgi:hypothetical protein